MPTQNIPSSPRRMAGVGLIEVLVAVVILAFGMLGIAAMQATSVRNSQSALEHSQATVLNYTILDAMRANAAVAKIHGYDLATMTCDVPDTGDLAANDLHNWITSVQSQLGTTACGQIVCGGLECTVSVQWDDSRGTHVGAAVPEVVTLKTRL